MGPTTVVLHVVRTRGTCLAPLPGIAPSEMSLNRGEVEVSDGQVKVCQLGHQDALNPNGAARAGLN